MSKSVTQADEPTLFPREWVIGRAAANLVRDDEGVLLDQPWIDPMAAVPPRPVAAPLAVTAPAPESPLTAPVPEVQAQDPPVARSLHGPAGTPVDQAGSPAPERRRRPQRPTAAEIEELKAVQARLQRRFEAARMRPRPRYLRDGDRPLASALVALGGGPAQTASRRPFPWRRLAISLVLAALASGLYQYRAVLLQL